MNASFPLTDSFGRRIEYLRISLTERCDLRCAYCRPARQRSASTDLLSTDDVAAIARAALGLGVRRIRLTGGEPLLRPDLTDIVRRVAALPGLADLSLTTNGQDLASHADALAEAGLRRVNISLDSLDPEVYATITGGGRLDGVLAGIEAALQAKLSPVKVNVVVTSPEALGREQLSRFADLLRTRPLHVRFIEAMPTCGHAAYVPAQRLLQALSALGELTPVAGPDGGGPAQYYQLEDCEGTFGVITPISEPFCASCNRLRVTAQGDLLACLFSPGGVSLLPALREGDPVAAVAAIICAVTAAKPRRYGDIAEPSGIVAMHVIGG
ncbi:MAG: GTP 3',8-cyclase MoaA [Armatimonadetes bacterium]|nr:GTP 3',8-cyclase MoaA [Armatimonadota bacterium]